LIDFDGRVEERLSSGHFGPLKPPQFVPARLMATTCKKHTLNEVTFVLGGVRSGKSRFVQQVAAAYRSVIFIATAKPSDSEMKLRIERHRKSRPAGWQTLEVPIDLDVAISRLEPGQFAVIDCLTIYLANVMRTKAEDESAIRQHTERLCSTLKNTKASIILVSNEVGSGVHPPTALGRLYCDLLGELNQRVAALADNVVLMTAGISLAVKGQLPVQAQVDFECDGEVSQPFR
jgi:adenosylcobinamide kinase/adenosylcobinamide-phosphate guanylyltransferase